MCGLIGLESAQFGLRYGVVVYSHSARFSLDSGRSFTPEAAGTRIEPSLQAPKPTLTRAKIMTKLVGTLTRRGEALMTRKQHDVA